MRPARTAMGCSGIRTLAHRRRTPRPQRADARLHAIMTGGIVMKTKIIPALLTAGVLCAGQSALAHHPFAAEYDAEKPVTLTGTLSRMEWVNPHSWIYLDVKQPDGTVQKWTIESSGPGAMSRRGLKKTDFVAGMSLVVKG